MKRYLTRVVKFAIYLILFLFVILVLLYMMSARVMSENASIWRFFQNGRPLTMLFIVFVFAALYPFIGFVTVKIYFNKLLDDNKQKVIDLFAQRKYVLEKDENRVLTFRHKSKLSRITRMNEDMLELDYSKTILTLHGLRKDLYRFKRMLEEFARHEDAQ